MRAFDPDFRTASDLAFDGDMIFMFDGDRGRSGDTVFEPGAILKTSEYFWEFKEKRQIPGASSS